MIITKCKGSQNKNVRLSLLLQIVFTTIDNEYYCTLYKLNI